MGLAGMNPIGPIAQCRCLLTLSRRRCNSSTVYRLDFLLFQPRSLGNRGRVLGEAPTAHLLVESGAHVVHTASDRRRARVSAT
jgi:hypothetical protein